MCQSLCVKVTVNVADINIKNSTQQELFDKFVNSSTNFKD